MAWILKVRKLLLEAERDGEIASKWNIKGIEISGNMGVVYLYMWYQS